MRRINKNILCVFVSLCLLSLALASCKGKSGAGDNEDSTALKETRAQQVKAVNDSILLATQQELAKTDSALQIAIAEHKALESKVTSQVTSKAEGDRLTQLRVKRDSLQIRFDVLCAKIRLIHMKQKQG